MSETAKEVPADAKVASEEKISAHVEGKSDPVEGEKTEEAKAGEKRKAEGEAEPEADKKQVTLIIRADVRLYSGRRLRRLPPTRAKGRARMRLRQRWSLPSTKMTRTQRISSSPDLDDAQRSTTAR